MIKVKQKQKNKFRIGDIVKPNGNLPLSFCVNRRTVEECRVTSVSEDGYFFDMTVIKWIDNDYAITFGSEYPNQYNGDYCLVEKVD